MIEAVRLHESLIGVGEWVCCNSPEAAMVYYNLSEAAWLAC